jgi:hypothetical protein
MRVREVEQLNEWQVLVILLRKELHRRGYDLRGATTERIVRIAETLPETRRLLNSLGYEYVFPPEEHHRLAECVRWNVAFMEDCVYAFGGIVDVVTVPCEHGQKVYCYHCWSGRVANAN